MRAMKARQRRGALAKAIARDIVPATHWLHASTQRSELLRCDGEPLSLRASEGTEGLVPSFDAVAYTGGVMFPNLAIAWKGPVVVDLQGLRIAKSELPIHRDHDESRPVAHTTTVGNDGRQLVTSGIFSVDSDDSREITDSSRKGFPWRPSIGVKIVRWTTIPNGQKIIVNGREFVGPIAVITESILKEISFVTMPGDDEASATIRASQGSESMPTFEEYVASLGLDAATLTPEATEALKKQFESHSAPPAAAATPAPNGTASEAVPVESDEDKSKATASSSIDLKATAADVQRITRETLASETERANGVRDLCAKFNNPQVILGGKQVDLCAHAIKEGWNMDQTELHARRHLDLEATRDRRPTGPAIHSINRSEVNSTAAIQAGLLLRAGCNLDAPEFENYYVRNRLPAWLQASVNDPSRQRAMEAGHQHSGLSLIDACRLGLQAAGHQVPQNRQDMLHASFSTGVASSLFGATIGAKMLQSYAEIRDFSEGWCQEDENPDLEQHFRYQTEALQNLALHPPGGEAAHTGLTVRGEPTQVHRFTRQMTIDEADFLSDNFGKFKDAPKMFGQAAGRLRPSLVAAILLSNPTLTRTGRALFNSTDGNTTSSAALARGTLSAAVARMSRRMDGDASIDLNATHLISAPELFDTAVQLTKSGLLSNDSGAGEMNPLKNYNIDPRKEPRLANGMVHPVTGANLTGSTVTWYLISAETNTIEVTYLQGAGRVPVVRTTDLVNGQFGLNVDVRHYVSATPLDWRGFDRNIG